MLFRQYLSLLAGRSVQSVNRFVIGNSSVDYDSFFGSIIFAFLLTTSTKIFHLPIIDCKRQQIHFRFQISEILHRLSIDSNVFHYKESLTQVNPDSWFSLYDHNIRKGITKVEYIVDHHDYKEPIARKYLITKMGSALTHLYYLMNPLKLKDYANQSCNEQVTDYYSRYMEFIEKQPFEDIQYDNNPNLQIQEIIRYGIIMDTFNLDERQRQRWTVLDKQALQWIQNNKVYNFGYKQLEELKFNQDLNKNLSLQAALNKDFKRFDYNGLIVQYSIIYLQPKHFYHHYQSTIQQQFLTKHQECNIYMLMSIFKGQNGRLQRQVMFKVKDQDETTINLLNSFLILLKMQKLGNLQAWNCWRDPSATISRKIFDKQFRNYYSQTMNK